MSPPKNMACDQPQETSGPGDSAAINPPTSDQTQEHVQDYIKALHRATKEFVKPSTGPSFYLDNDPHLRLRRTLTPSLREQGIPTTPEAQFMIQGSTGKRLNVEFSLWGEHFTMDVYAWGASERDAQHRMVAVHGLTPGVSRTRWHSLGERLGGGDLKQHKIRFVALDWHSIDRSIDKPNEDFLTMLPKHFFSGLSDEAVELMSKDLPKEVADKAKNSLTAMDAVTPRSFEDGAAVLRAVIEQGLEWGTSPDTKFILGIKSWSGGVGVPLLAQARNADDTFGRNIAGAVIMHPASFEAQVAADAVGDGTPTIMCWAKDDARVPFAGSENFAKFPNVKLVAYESGGHANFDGSRNLPNFDDEIIEWMRHTFLDV